MTALSPRCGRPMRRRYDTEVPGVPFVCGRPEGHNGPCRSRVAVRRKQLSDHARSTENAVHAAGDYRHGTLCGQSLPHGVTDDHERVTCRKCNGILDGTYKPYVGWVTAA